MNHKERVLGGFIRDVSFHDYRKAFCRMFYDLHCRLDDCGLVFFWHQSKPQVSESLANRVELWHMGYRACLVQMNPADYS